MLTLENANSTGNSKILILFSSIVAFILGFVLCSNWIKMLDTYGKLNSAKMEIISQIEKFLPVQIYDTEWKVQNDKIKGKKYISFTKIEQQVPKIFLILYFVLLVIGILFFFL